MHLRVQSNIILQNTNNVQYALSKYNHKDSKTFFLQLNTFSIRPPTHMYVHTSRYLWQVGILRKQFQIEFYTILKLHAHSKTISHVDSTFL